jgi:hypothetical protein
MAFVYRNALLTLAVSKPSEIDYDLVYMDSKVVNIEEYSLSELSALSNDSDPRGPRRRDHDSYLFRVGLSNINRIKFEVIVATDPEKPLNRRAWVMQEHLLAPRTIHFADQIVWECREMTQTNVFAALYLSL